MAVCSSCSAPLPANTSRCSYCGTHNDMDVAAVNRFAASREESRRQCPDCRIPLQTIHLTLDGAFAVERCERCFGLFFDPGEVQAFLDASVSTVYEINYQQIVNVQQERGGQERPVRYIPCPECGTIMHRVNFGYQSGVVMDQCKQHGVWLDNGELTQLLEWKKAGGQLLDEKRKLERRKEAERARQRDIHTEGGYGSSGGLGDITLAADLPVGSDAVDLVSAAFALIGKLFR